MKPMVLNATSPATIISTPKVMVRMMKISFQDGVSRRKRKAKRRTKIRVEDLVIAKYSCQYKEINKYRSK